MSQPAAEPSAEPSVAADAMPVAAAAPAAPLAPFAPVATAQRIEALDVVRGFALLGIFLMNIEFFNRAVATLNEGMPRGLTGLDWLASWFIAYFVQGKFWTIFSLLFGMGFAVMLVRAERAGRTGRAFTKVYLRRILALAVFGAAHFIFLWDGDILFSYAVGALGLLIVLYGRARPILIGIAVLIGLGFIPDFDLFFRVAGGLVTAGLLALYLRGEKRFRLKGLSMPLFSFILLLVGLAVSAAAVVFWLLPDGPIEPRVPLSIFGPLLLVTGWLSWRYHEPIELRSVRMAVSIYVFMGAAITAGGLIQYFGPDPLAVAGTGVSADKSADKVAGKATDKTAVPTPALTAPAGASATLSKATANAGKDKPRKTREERVAELKAEREKRLLEGREEKEREIKVLTSGSYWETVDFRARKFLEKAAGDAGFGVALIGMFLLGMWFVRSGVMENTGAHLPFFRKLALYALPLGIAMGLASSLIAMSHTPGERHDGWGIARGLQMLGNLPACVGYVGLVVTLLHSSTVFSRIRVLAPLGRMALTNYLMQSLICALYFFGYGLGHWGMPRAQQVLFVAVVYIAQIAFSHWWLARFRYGPMEWLWRGFTYREVPALRIGTAAEGTPAQVA